MFRMGPAIEVRRQEMPDGGRPMTND